VILRHATDADAEALHSFDVGDTSIPWLAVERAYQRLLADPCACKGVTRSRRKTARCAARLRRIPVVTSPVVVPVICDRSGWPRPRQSA
jgi:hypothetical protein